MQPRFKGGPDTEFRKKQGEQSNDSLDAVVFNKSPPRDNKMGDPSSGPFEADSPQLVRHNRTSSQFSNYNKSKLGVEKQASQLTMSVIENIQGKNPSFKF